MKSGISPGSTLEPAPSARITANRSTLEARSQVPDGDHDNLRPVYGERSLSSSTGEAQPKYEAPIVQVADAISASRPGARGETMETYVKRLEDLQGIAESFGGVEKSFAVQAGREVRILVRPEEIDDLSATRLARDIVKKIEDELTYPGQIKVTVIRETRAVEYAK